MKSVICVIMLYLVSVCSAEQRTWKAVNGKEVEAEFVSSEKGIVKLKLKSGKVVNVPLNKLSKSDQGFIKAKSSSDSLANNIVGKVMTLELEGNLGVVGQVQLNEDGRIMTGENGDLEDLGLTYKIEGNEVLIFQDGKRNGGISFSCSSPKVSDQIEMGPKGSKQKSTILKIEAAQEMLNNPLAKGKPAKNVSVRAPFKYKTEGDKVTITGCQKRASGELVIPDTIKGKLVTTIGDSAFRGCTSLKSITIPDSVTSIGNYAFEACLRLTNITIPDGVTRIGANAFAGCGSLTSITIPDGVTSIGESAFFGCSDLTSITIHDSVTSIELGAFSLCSSLTALTFLGDAPKAKGLVFMDETPTIYRKPEAKGWGDTWGGRPVKLISEKP